MSSLLGTDGQPVSAHPGPGVIKTPEPDAGEKTPDKDAEPEPDWLARKDDGTPEVEFPVEVFDDRIVIKRDDRTSLTASGLYIPDGARQKPMTGTVVSIGAGMLKGDGTRMAMFVAPGDKIVFEQNRGMTPISVNGYWYHILRQTDLLGRARGEVKIKGEK